jgi:hypothetical protein
VVNFFGHATFKPKIKRDNLEDLDVDRNIMFTYVLKEVGCQNMDLAQVGIQWFSSFEHGIERSVFNIPLTIFQLYFRTVSSIVQNMLHVSASP